MLKISFSATQGHTTKDRKKSEFQEWKIKSNQNRPEQ
jgi:hypothetical protein